MYKDRSFTEQLQRHIGHKTVHKDEMAYAAGHYKQMKDFVGAEVLMLPVKDGNRHSSAMSRCANDRYNIYIIIT